MEEFAFPSIDIPTVNDAVNKMLESCYTLDAVFAYSAQEESLFFNDSSKSLFLLGKQFTTEDGLKTVKEYVTSRLWFTYRKNFSPIGGTGPTSDQGWGCMLRCAQMLLGETLLRRHIGKHFIWPRTIPTGDYERLLRMFLDQKTALYSIHQIAQMGVTEGKDVGEWFGPNTAAQVLKKLSVFDSWSNIAVHVALDNILITKDAVTMATTQPTKDDVLLIGADGHVDESHLSLFPMNEVGATCSWRPLLLIVPLRLGLTTINRCYLPALQEYFKLDSCVGIIGGRPNHALYFIGMSNERLIYLDPHYCRPSILETMRMDDEEFKDIEKIEDALEASASLILTDDGSGKMLVDDSTFHCEMLLSMSYDHVDPSLAMCFFCPTKEDFNKLTKDLKNQVFPASSPPIFEQLPKRPKYWPLFEPYVGVKTKIDLKDFDDMGAPNYDIDDGFEVLEDEFAETDGNASDEQTPLNMNEISIINNN